MPIHRHSPSAGSPRFRFGRSPAAGFTLLEMMMVVVIAGVLIGMAAIAFSASSTRTSARRAAQVFSRDLALARSSAVRGREKVVINFDESNMWYSVTTASGRELARRRFGVGGDVNLSAVDLQMSGDSVFFSTRGIATISGALGIATFTAGVAT